MKTNIVRIFGLGTVVSIITLTVWTYTQAEGNQIQVCVKKSGLVYVIGDEFRRSDCKKNDSFLSWNTTSLQGPKGDKGDKGDRGTTLRLTDDANHDLGRFLNVVTDDSLVIEGQNYGYSAYIENLGLFVKYNTLGGGAVYNPSWNGEDNNSVLFSEPNCTSGYVSRYKSGFLISLAGNYGQNGLPPYSDVHIRQLPNGGIVTTQVKSRYSEVNSNCLNIEDGEVRAFGGEVINFPISGKIRIIER